MNFMKKVLVTGLLSLICNTASFSAENAFYVLRSNMPARISSNEHSFSSLTKHYNSINLLISQAYQIDANGMVWGFLDPAVLEFTNKHKVKLMVLITNVDFDKEKSHRFLSNPAAQAKAIQAIVNACVKKHFYGVQFDFEMIKLEDRDALTKFYHDATDALHKKGFIVSYAVAPVVSDNPQASEFLKKLYVVWEGAYDLKALGEFGDFVSIMAYNQHGEGTTPGPTASLPWVEETVKYTLQYVPADKISLGIASYSSYWYTGSNSSGRITTQLAGIGYDKVNYLLDKYKPTVQWDDKDKDNYAIYEHNWLNEYLFIEDAKSFAKKLKLVEKYHLRGISVFDLGGEDPKIWNVLEKN